MNQQNTSRMRGNLLVLSAALIWSTGGFLIKFIPWNSIVINCLRSILAFILLAVINRGVRIRITKSVLGGAIGLAAVTTLFVIANKMTTAANAIVLQYMSPIFVLIMTCIKDRKLPKKQQVITICITFGGMILFFIDQLEPGYVIGNIVAILSGVGFACVFFFNAQPDGSSQDANMLGFLISFVIGLPFVFLYPPAPTSSSVLALAVLGIFQVGFSYYIFGIGLKQTDPVTASLISMIEAIANPVLVMIIIGEKPGIFAFIGCCMILFAVAMNIVKGADSK